MMMGVGIIFILVIGLIVIGVPLLIIAMITGGRLASWFRSEPQQASPPIASMPRQEPDNMRTCPTCGRAAKPDWNICPTCGAALT